MQPIARSVVSRQNSGLRRTFAVLCTKIKTQNQSNYVVERAILNRSISAAEEATFTQCRQTIRLLKEFSNFQCTTEIIFVIYLTMLSAAEVEIMDFNDGMIN
jgi:hypothetical protein